MGKYLQHLTMAFLLGCATGGLVAVIVLAMRGDDESAPVEVRSTLDPVTLSDPLEPWEW